MKTPTSLPRCLAIFVALLVASAFGQPTTEPSTARKQPGQGKGGQARPRDREPSWMMDKVTGPNLHYESFDSKTAGTRVSYLIYLPPGYEKETHRRYPVVYWLHGIGGSQQGVPGFATRMNAAIKEGKMPPVIFVYCNGMIRSGWSDAQWPVETVTIKELIPHIDATYRTIATREGRGVEGFSMGGGGASVWGFKYTELFGTVSIIAGAMRDPNAPPRPQPAANPEAGAKSAAPAERGPRSNPWELVEKNGDQIRGRTFVRIAVGGRDNLKTTNTRLHEFLTQHDIAHDFDIVDDAPHSPGPVYEGLGDKNWAFYHRAFGHVK